MTPVTDFTLRLPSNCLVSGLVGTLKRRAMALTRRQILIIGGSSLFGSHLCKSGPGSCLLW